VAATEAAHGAPAELASRAPDADADGDADPGASPANGATLPPLRGRLLGVDVARALAIVGMLAVHVGPTGDTSLAGRVYALAHGRASLLFVLVAGVGVSLLVRSRSTSVPDARRTLLWRAAMLLPAGLALQLMDHGVNVILQGYAALFVLAAVLLTVTDRVLLWGAGSLALVGPLVFLVGRMGDPARFSREEVAWGDSASAVVDGLVLSGPYPVVTWAAPLLLGMWLGRRALDRRRLQWQLVAIGSTAAITTLAVSLVGRRLTGGGPSPGWHDLLSAAPHSQMPLWLVGGVGAAAAMLGLALVATDLAPRALRPLIALGQLAFTAYVAHLVALHLWTDALRGDEVGRSTVVVLVGTAVLAGSAWLWRTLAPRGPLEVLLRPPRALRSDAPHTDAARPAATTRQPATRP
jgi:uncharacterized membrane protein YeiB